MINNAEIIHNMGKAYYMRAANTENLLAPVSKSLLWEFNQSPYKWRHSTSGVSSKAMELGTLIHKVILEPNVPIEHVAAVSPFANFRTKAAQEWRDDQREMNRMIATEEDIRAASGCEKVFWEDYEEHFTGDCETEVAIFATVGGTPIKGMIDLVPHNSDALVDLKTTAKIGSLFDVSRTIISRGYHWQAALYLDLWNAASGENRKRFIICFIETDEPHESAWVEISPELIAAGREGYMGALAKWQSCVAIDSWPRRHEGLSLIEKPTYQ
jgi:hypothetical protein